MATSLSGKLVGLFVGTIIVGLAINVIVNPAVDTITKGREEVKEITVGRTGTTNSTGNQTGEYKPSVVGIFGDPRQQLDALLLSLGLVIAIVAAASVAGFLTSGSSAEAAKVGGIVGFLSTIAIIVVNVLFGVQPAFEAIPVVGQAIFVIGTASTFVIITYAAAGLISGGSAY